jgi:hypothetical protein
VKKSGSFNFLFLILLSWIVPAIFPICSYKAHAANIRTTISQNQVLIGDVFTVSIEVSFGGESKPAISIFETPKHPNISFLRQSEATSYQTIITNGSAKTKKTITLNMIFYAKAKGIANIPLVKLKINDKVFAAKGFKIEVLEKSAVQKNNPKNQKQSSKNRRNNMSGMESLLNQFFGNEGMDVFGGAKDAVGTNLDFFVDVEPSNMFPYFYEQFTADWYLYTNGRVTDIDTLKYPALEGFWKDEISLATSLTPESVERNGKMYTRYLLASYALTPIVNGQSFIDPYEVKCQLVGGIFSFGSKELIRKSDEVLIKVKNLPEPKPQNFTGAVGDFQVSSFLLDQSFKAGQPFTYVIKVSGQGQLKFMELPDLGLNEDQFTIYDKSEESQFIPPLRSVKTYKILVVPKTKGVMELPAVGFSFFDPRKNEYYNMNTKPIRINVLEGEIVEQDIVSAYDPSKKNIFVPELYSTVSGSPLLSLQMSSLFAYLTVLFGLLTSLGLMLYRFFGLQITYDFEKDLKSRFDNLEELIQQNRWRDASTLAVNIVYFFANAKSKKKPKSQRLDDILMALPVGLRRSIETSIVALNTDLQKYSFAPEHLMNNSEIKEKVLEKCLALKALLERSSLDEFKN